MIYKSTSSSNILNGTNGESLVHESRENRIGDDNNKRNRQQKSVMLEYTNEEEGDGYDDFADDDENVSYSCATKADRVDALSSDFAVSSNNKRQKDTDAEHSRKMRLRKKEAQQALANNANAISERMLATDAYMQQNFESKVDKHNYLKSITLNFLQAWFSPAAYITSTTTPVPAEDHQELFLILSPAVVVSAPGNPLLQNDGCQAERVNSGNHGRCIFTSPESVLTYVQRVSAFHQSLVQRSSSAVPGVETLLFRCKLKKYAFLVEGNIVMVSFTVSTANALLCGGKNEFSFEGMLTAEIDSSNSTSSSSRVKHQKGQNNTTQQHDPLVLSMVELYCNTEEVAQKYTYSFPSSALDNNSLCAPSVELGNDSRNLVDSLVTLGTKIIKSGVETHQRQHQAQEVGSDCMLVATGNNGALSAQFQHLESESKEVPNTKSDRLERFLSLVRWIEDAHRPAKAPTVACAEAAKYCRGLRIASSSGSFNSLLEMRQEEAEVASEPVVPSQVTGGQRGRDASRVDHRGKPSEPAHFRQQQLSSSSSGSTSHESLTPRDSLPSIAVEHRGHRINSTDSITINHNNIDTRRDGASPGAYELEQPSSPQSCCEGASLDLSPSQQLSNEDHSDPWTAADAVYDDVCHFFHSIRESNLIPALTAQQQETAGASGHDSRVFAEFISKCDSLHCDREVRSLLGRADQAVTDGDSHTAIERLSQIITLDPRYIEAYFRRSTLFAALHMHSECMVDLDRVLTVSPTHCGALCGKGMLCFHLDMFATALHCFERACQLCLWDAALCARLQPLIAACHSRLLSIPPQPLLSSAVSISHK